MSWKQWKRGLLIATLTGLGTGAVGFAAGAPIKAALAVFIICLGKDLVLYCKQHPIESVKETDFVRRIPLLLAVTLLAVTCLAGCARLVSHQVRIDCDGSRTESWQRISTFWDSQSSVAKLRATISERSQGLTLTGVDQESESTNVNALVSEAVGAAVRAALTP